MILTICFCLIAFNCNAEKLEEILLNVIPSDPSELSGDVLVDYINAIETTWTATKHSKFSAFSDEVKWGLMGVNHIGHSIEAKMNQSPTRFEQVDIPASFDSRIEWPHCQSLQNIRDQSSCGSCWAFGAVEAMSDRICIASMGRIKVTLSSADLLSCCADCGMGCDGGNPLDAWKYWVNTGIVTGTNYTSHKGCKPYPFPPCEHHNNKTHFAPCHHKLYPTPHCQHVCQSGYEKQHYEQDKYYGASAYGVEAKVESIQKEMLIHGPLEVAFEVYEDFLNYKSGIYQHKGGKLGGGHAVKLIGWGEENSVPYWIVANSWNRDWGEEGFFRIIRGIDECGIESGAVGGIPRLNLTKMRKYHRYH